MSLNAAEVKKVAHLAKLSLSDAEIAQYAQQLSQILLLVEKMNKVNTDHIAPVAHSLDLNLRVRPDIVTEKNERDLFQSIAPAVDAGLYLVPKQDFILSEKDS